MSGKDSNHFDPKPTDRSSLEIWLAVIATISTAIIAVTAIIMTILSVNCGCL